MVVKLAKQNPKERKKIELICTIGKEMGRE